jgi:UDP-N-acetylglucosamine transferase subunit ALG13
MSVAFVTVGTTKFEDLVAIIEEESAIFCDVLFKIHHIRRLIIQTGSIQPSFTLLKLECAKRTSPFIVIDWNVMFCLCLIFIGAVMSQSGLS